jgi:hypothetical protein
MLPEIFLVKRAASARLLANGTSRPRRPVRQHQEKPLVLTRQRNGRRCHRPHRFANDCDYKAAFDWLRSHGFETYLGEPPAPKKVLKEYDYTDENGARLYQTVRFEPKDFRQRRSDGYGGWIWKGPERPVPYKLPELISERQCPGLDRWRREGCR